MNEAKITYRFSKPQQSWRDGDPQTLPDGSFQYMDDAIISFWLFQRFFQNKINNPDLLSATYDDLKGNIKNFNLQTQTWE